MIIIAAVGIALAWIGYRRRDIPVS